MIFVNMYPLPATFVILKDISEFYKDNRVVVSKLEVSAFLYKLTVGIEIISIQTVRKKRNFLSMSNKYRIVREV
jgi:hypothetical protein